VALPKKASQMEVMTASAEHRQALEAIDAVTLEIAQDSAKRAERATPQTPRSAAPDEIPPTPRQA